MPLNRETHAGTATGCCLPWPSGHVLNALNNYSPQRIEVHCFHFRGGEMVHACTVCRFYSDVERVVAGLLFGRIAVRADRPHAATVSGELAGHRPCRRRDRKPFIRLDHHIDRLMLVVLAEQEGFAGILLATGSIIPLPARHIYRGEQRNQKDCPQNPFRILFHSSASQHYRNAMVLLRPFNINFSCFALYSAKSGQPRRGLPHSCPSGFPTGLFRPCCGISRASTLPYTILLG